MSLMVIIFKSSSGFWNKMNTTKKKYEKNQKGVVICWTIDGMMFGINIIEEDTEKKIIRKENQKATKKKKIWTTKKMNAKSKYNFSNDRVESYMKMTPTKFIGNFKLRNHKWRKICDFFTVSELQEYVIFFWNGKKN